MAHPTELDALYAFLVAALVTALLTRGLSGRSTSRATGACPNARRRCWVGLRSSAARSWPR
jgi:hypothetical protein